MDKSQTRGGLVLGAILIIIGLLFFVGQLVDFLNWGNFWPLLIIGAGMAFFAGMVLGGRSASPLAIPGSIISGVGLILLVQSVLGLWESWAYAWGLVIAFVGLGIAIHGYWGGKPEATRSGWETFRVGLILFLVFGVITEFIFAITGISGRQNQLLLAVLLTALGVLQFLWRAARLLFKPEAVSEAGRDLMGPIILAGIGILATLAVLKVLPAWDLLKLLSLWPLLLIAAGFQLIVGRKSPWIGALIGILLVGVVLVIALAGGRLGIRLGMPFPMVISGSEPWEVRERVAGNGVISQRAYPVRGFDRISLEIPGKMEIVTSGQEALTIQAEENLLPYIQVNVRGNRLVIEVEPGIGLEPSQDITLQVQVQSLQEVDISAAAEVAIAALQTEALELNSSGVGTFRLADIQAERLDIQIDGSGAVEAAGKVERLEVEISGAGDLQGASLQVGQAEISVSGLGNATVWVEDTLEARISGAGTIAYYGDPKVTQTISGAGVVRKAGEK